MHLTRLLHGKTAARGPGVLALTNPDRHCREALTVVPSAEARPNNHSAASAQPGPQLLTEPGLSLDRVPLLASPLSLCDPRGATYKQLHRVS